MIAINCIVLIYCILLHLLYNRIAVCQKNCLYKKTILFDLKWYMTIMKTEPDQSKYFKVNS